MKLFALLGAGALAAGTVVAATPATAQYRGHDGYQREYQRDGGYRHGYAYRGGYGGGYRGGYRHGYYGRGPGWRGGYRHHVSCRVHRGYYHPVRRCY